MAEIVAIKPVVAEGPVVSQQDKGVLRLTLASPPANALSLAVMATLRRSSTAQKRTNPSASLSWRPPERCSAPGTISRN